MIKKWEQQFRDELRGQGSTAPESAMVIAASTLRRVLIDHVRSRRSQQPDGGLNRVERNDPIPADAWESYADRLLALDDALSELSPIDERQARVVELRFFAGLTAEETAEALGITPRAAMREWAIAKAWLYSRMSA